LVWNLAGRGYDRTGQGRPLLQDVANPKHYANSPHVVVVLPPPPQPLPAAAAGGADGAANASSAFADESAPDIGVGALSQEHFGPQLLSDSQSWETATSARSWPSPAAPTSSQALMGNAGPAGSGEAASLSRSGGALSLQAASGDDAENDDGAGSDSHPPSAPDALPESQEPLQRPPAPAAHVFRRAHLSASLAMDESSNSESDALDAQRSEQWALLPTRTRTILPRGVTLPWRRRPGYGSSLAPALGSVIEYPVVTFSNGRQEHVPLREFTNEVPGLGASVLHQVPLKLAWSITTHKSQGMSLSFVRIDVGNAFAAGQVYVALSRARAEDGLELRGTFRASKVLTDPLVNHFHMCTTPRAPSAVSAAVNAGRGGGSGGVLFAPSSNGKPTSGGAAPGAVTSTAEGGTAAARSNISRSNSLSLGAYLNGGAPAPVRGGASASSSSSQGGGGSGRKAVAVSKL
jgi:hypothetical protein